MSAVILHDEATIIHDTGVDSSPETLLDPSTLHNAEPDVTIKVYVGFDPLSDEQVEEARKAIEALEQYGFVAVLEPIVASWMHAGSIGVVSDELPVVVINGHVVGFGRVVTAQEIVDAALAFLGESAREDPLLLRAGMGPGEFLSAVAS